MDLKVFLYILRNALAKEVNDIGFDSIKCHWSRNPNVDPNYVVFTVTIDGVAFEMTLREVEVSDAWPVREGEVSDA